MSALSITLQDLEVKKAGVWEEVKGLLAKGLVRVDVTSSGRSIRFFLDPEDHSLNDLKESLFSVPRRFLPSA